MVSMYGYNQLFKTLQMKRILLFMTLVFAFNLTANAQYYEWIGGSGNWEDPNNWEDENGDPGLPGFNADVNIGGNDVFLYYDPQFVDLFNSIYIYDNATLVATDRITVIDNFSLDEFSTVELYLEDVNSYGNGFIEVLSGTYNIDGNIIPVFGGTSFVPQIGDQITLATAGGSGSTCGIFNIGNAVTSDNGISIFEVAYLVQCISPNEIILNINGINYTGAKSWDGEAGNGLWSTPANWDPNEVPTPDEWVIINKNGGASVTTGSISQDRISIGKDNTLTATGNIEISHVVKLNETASLNWTAGRLKKRVDGDFPTIDNLGTLTVNGIIIDDIGTIVNDETGVIEMNGNINIDTGRLFNLNGATININGDNLTIGYTSGTQHQLLNSFNSTIEKTVTSGTGTSSIILADFQNWNGGIVRSEQGTLAIGENFVNQGTVTGSGSFSFPVDFINTGVISPGSSPGVLTVIGDLTTVPEADFNIEIDGPNAGTEYDQVVVTNEAILEGTLNVILGYLPENDASFEVVTAGTLTSCNFPAQVTSNYNDTDYTFDVVCQNNVLYLKGPGATLTNPSFEAETIGIYPNPIKNEFNIKLQTQSEGAWLLYNELGQNVMKGQLQGLETKINTETLVSGFYALQIKHENNVTITVKKIIKN